MARVFMHKVFMYKECIETTPLNFLNHSPIVFSLGPGNESINLQDEFKRLPPYSVLLCLSNNQTSCLTFIMPTFSSPKMSFSRGCPVEF